MPQFYRIRRTHPGTRPRRSIIIITIIAMIAALTVRVMSATALTPDQVAVIVNGNIAGSWQVGRYYLKARNIPATHLIVLNLENHNVNDMPASYYTQRVADTIKQILRERHLAKQIKCLVTTYGIPLRVGRQKSTPAQTQEFTKILADLDQCAAELQQGSTHMRAIAAIGAGANTAPATPAPFRQTAPARAKAALSQFRAAAEQAIQHYQNLPPDLRSGHAHEFLALLRKFFGPGGMAEMMHVHGDSLNAMTQEEALQSERALVLSQLRKYQHLAIHRDHAADRREMRQLQLRLFGIIGLTEQLLSDQMYLSQHGRRTSLDNDLMMLWYHARPPILWHVNPDYLPIWQATDSQHHAPEAIMVSRLDGLTPEMVIHMIQTSVAVERRGLHGVAYFDARGLHGKDPYSLFDNDIRATARYILKHASIHVVLNDTPALLQARNCPRAALYCGWYSLHHYVDSCQWLPGCVGYHVASFELTTLHDPTDTGWCINLLKHGVVGTLGAVAEPYLQAFPRPSLFFPLLLSGQFTQAEVYFLTTPQVGWRIAYVGDPLYNPFKHDPRISKATFEANPLFAKAIREIRTLNY